MKKNLLTVFIFCGIVAHSQNKASIDELMNRSDYAGALKEIEILEQQPGSPNNDSDLVLRKAEALIHLGKFDEGRYQVAT